MPLFRFFALSLSCPLLRSVGSAAAFWQAMRGESTAPTTVMGGSLPERTPSGKTSRGSELRTSNSKVLIPSTIPSLIESRPTCRTALSKFCSGIGISLPFRRMAWTIKVLARNRTRSEAAPAASFGSALPGTRFDGVKWVRRMYVVGPVTPWGAIGAEVRVGAGTLWLRLLPPRRPPRRKTDLRCGPERPRRPVRAGVCRPVGTLVGAFDSPAPRPGPHRG